MAIDGPLGYAELHAVLNGGDWVSLLDGVAMAETWVRVATPGDPRIDEVVKKLLTLADHSKWEVRRAVANAAAQMAHPAFETTLPRLLGDDNTRVRQAAERAALRRRDRRNSSTLGRQHEDRINAALDDIEVRFGARGRDAVKRAAEQIANTFARELYHEVIRLMTPLATSAGRLRTKLFDERTTRAELAEDAGRIERLVAHLGAVLKGMRAYTELPTLTFQVESLKDIIEEAASLVREPGPDSLRAPIHIDVEESLAVEVSRARLVQAVTNVLTNAIESYDGVEQQKPIIVRAEADEGRVLISIEDVGCGMSDEVLADAIVLFASKKANGTGFGLPLAIKIVESEHGGRLSLESRKGRGTVVRMVIPVHRLGVRI